MNENVKRKKKANEMMSLPQLKTFPFVQKENGDL
jgi:hypothetical protein